MYNAGSITLDSTDGRIYLLGRASGSYALYLHVLDGSTGASIDNVSLQQAGDAVMLLDDPHHRLGIYSIMEAREGEFYCHLTDVDTSRDAVIAQSSSKCLLANYLDLPLALDPATGRMYWVDSGPRNHDDMVLGYNGVVTVWNLIDGTTFGSFSVRPCPSPAQVIGTMGFALVSSENTTSIVGPARSTPATAVGPCSPGCEYFPQTHHNLSGPFLALWRRYGGVDTFGYPRTEPYTENGRVVQYTDRFVLELVHGRVRTADINQFLVNQRTFGAAPAQASPSSSLYNTSTHHTLSGRFLTYWRAHHGDALLGAPISEPFMEGNDDGSGRRYLLQWFEKGRLEYHPELRGTRYEMELGLVGLQSLRQRGWVSSAAA